MLDGEIDRYTLRKRYLRKDGEVVWTRLTVALVRTRAGQPQYFISVVEDIGEQVRAEQRTRELNEELEQRIQQRTAALVGMNHDLKQFAYVASHDLREPLRKLRMFGDRLRDRRGDALDERGRDYLERMRAACVRMDQLLRDLLDFSRAIGAAPREERVELDALVSEVLAGLDLRVEETGGRVIVESGLPVVRGDPTLLQQLFENLLTNALKFHRPGVPPEVRVHPAPDAPDAAALAADGAFVAVAVRDNGIGIPEDRLDTISQPFVRLHGRQEYDGTGMGLAICRRIVERHGGALRAFNRPGGGTTFLVTLAPSKEKSHVSAT